MKVSDFDYYLPEELIAQQPLKRRDHSRMLVYDRKDKKIEHRIFYQITEYLSQGDCLVLNDTRVLPARLYGVREDTGGKIELLLLERSEKDQWETLVKPGKRARIGTRLSFGDGLLRAEVVDILKNGSRIIEFQYEGIFEEILDEIGVMPLPPYIQEKLEEKDRYQTVYNKYAGSSAAPTAGLHFTQELLDDIDKMGVKIAGLTLHVGLGTFRPVKVDNIQDHKMHFESYFVSREAADTINQCRKSGGRIIAVGTTSARTLETVVDDRGIIHPGVGRTDIFIYPGYNLKGIDGLITNFHLPKSTLIMLVGALIGKDQVLDVYRKAVEEKYRFFSFGDAMLIL
ncbi:MAG: tRNA preQ1(34) S-adenosylmethionine ribosyltransferase-isomerase QueA [Clostridiales bacterium]|nr:tRNA preQ1(34) S-adenosylmethionine ribosyltransferase-isomerase QueA [Clostridiales bacterium]